MTALERPSFGKSFLSQWDGYYEQDGTKYRFRAEFLLNENRLQGKITDLDSIYSRLLIDDYLDLSSLSQSEKIAHKQKVAQRLGCADTDAIEVSREQTDKSRVKGTVDKRFISFVKTYESDVVITFFTDTFKTSFETKPYAVQYEGTLSEDGTQITGKWFLQEKFANVLLEGPFAMTRL